MKVIIAGSRDFNDYEFLCKVCDYLLSHRTRDEIEIVSGTARGADSLGEKYAKEKGFSLKLFPAEWVKYGNAAGFKRNAQMASYGDALIAFWDGKSKGTTHMINLAKDRKLNVKVINYMEDKIVNAINAIIDTKIDKNEKTTQTPEA